jgi:AhpD family alkylhydroperoxidase
MTGHAMNESIASYTRLTLPDTSRPADDTTTMLNDLKRSRGKELNIFRLLSVHPDLLARFSALGTLFGDGALPPRVRELAILRTAAACDCEYERYQHTARALQAGLTAEEIAAAGSGEPAMHHPWAELELVVLNAVSELNATRRLSDATWSKLQAYFSDIELVEFACLVAFYVCVAHVVGGLDIPLEASEQPDDLQPRSSDGRPVASPNPDQAEQHHPERDPKEK